MGRGNWDNGEKREMDTARRLETCAIKSLLIILVIVL